MSFIRSKLIIGLMLLTFIGQAVAYNYVSCNMNASSDQVTSNLNVQTTHSHDELKTLSHIDDVSRDTHEHDSPICEKDCCCPMSSCFGLALVNGPIILNDLAISAQKISQFQNLNLASYPSSLYRPPILS